MNISSGARARRFAIIAAACVLLCAAGSPDGAGAARADDLPDCRAGAVVIVAGTTDVGAPSQLGVQQRYTGKSPADGTYAGQNEYKVIKPDYPTTLWPIGTVGYDDDVARGTAATVAAIAEYQRECPGREVVVVGYSQGARVAGDVLNRVATSAETMTGNGITYKKVVIDGEEYWISQENMRGELYSDPRRDGPESGRGIE
ncbi:PE-PPE domain-containing protein, partial [Gordonia sp. (in: high G+C Gram-positive bacteria)]